MGNKSQLIRDAVTRLGSATREQVAAETDLPLAFVGSILRQRVQAGEFAMERVNGADRFHVVRGRYGPRVLMATAEGLRVQSFAELVDKVRAPAPVVAAAPNIGRLLVEHAQATFESLKLTVDLTDAEPSTVAAFNVHAQALRLLGGGV